MPKITNGIKIDKNQKSDVKGVTSAGKVGVAHVKA